MTRYSLCLPCNNVLSYLKRCQWSRTTANACHWSTSLCRRMSTPAVNDRKSYGKLGRRLTEAIVANSSFHHAVSAVEHSLQALLQETGNHADSVSDVVNLLSKTLALCTNRQRVSIVNKMANQQTKVAKIWKNLNGVSAFPMLSHASNRWTNIFQTRNLAKTLRSSSHNNGPSGRIRQ